MPQAKRAHPKSFARLLGPVMDSRRLYLAQTDTTVGFLSQKSDLLAKVKNRPFTKPFLIEVVNLQKLQKFARVPKRWKNMVRRASHTTFVYPNGQAVRVVRNEWHLRFLRRFGWMYSTSANPSGQSFDEQWARNQADVVVEDWRGLFEGKASHIFKLSNQKIKKLR